MAWIVPKLDWLPDDYINFVDFNRIENNTREVAEYLNSIQYVLPSLTIIDNGDKSSIDFISSINRIEQNLERIRTNFLTPPGYGGAKNWAAGIGFTYEDANRLESNLQLLLEYGLLVYKSFRYCGVAICGETGVIY